MVNVVDLLKTAKLTIKPHDGSLLQQRAINALAVPPPPNLTAWVQQTPDENNEIT
jgi:hypothetical protein